MSVVNRGGVYYLRRRVPVRFSNIETRRIIQISLKTDSEKQARAKEPVVWQACIDAWEAALAGEAGSSLEQFEQVQKIAAASGFRYLTSSDVADLPLEKVLERVEAIEEGRADTKVQARALLGAVTEPQVSVSEALELYWQLTRDKVLGKSADQLRRWRNPRIKAINNFIAQVGDKAIPDITRDDMLDFRDWWFGRIESGEVSANSANKDFTHLGEILKTVNDRKRLGYALPLGGLSFKEGEANTRPPFSNDWIRDVLLKKGALDGLNAEARAIFLVMVNTGMRPSEIAGLQLEEIKLDAETPHLSLAPNGRQLKTRNARRSLPLLGVSLAAMRQFPEGFPSYRNNAATLSGTVNKFLRSNGLAESPAHSMYSLRHSFEDRMLEAGIDERIRRDILGHALGRERYGKGASIEMAADLLRPIAF